jgi:hypothetical protein
LRSVEAPVVAIAMVAILGGVRRLEIFSGWHARITRTAAARWLEGNRNCSRRSPMTEKDMAVLAALAGFAWWTYVFLPLVYFH